MQYTYEDERLVYFVYYKYFKKYSRYKDDLLQAGRLQLISKKSQYELKRNIKESTYKVTLIKTGMQSFIKKQFHTWRAKNELNTKVLDYNAPSNKDCDILISETIKDDKVDLDSRLNYEYLLSACFQVLNNLTRGQRFNKVIIEYLKDNNQKIVAKRLNISHQYVSKCVSVFRQALKEKLIREEYF